MIPIGTDVQPQRPPVGNWALIFLNVLVFVATDVLGVAPAIKDALALNGSLPALGEYVTYQFLHGDLWHLAGNMLFLWVFGNAVCDRMGTTAYVLFYLGGGVFAGVVFAHFNQNPMVGASGSIAAVTTAFLVLYPRVHVTILLLFLIITTFQIPAMFLIVFKIILWDNVIAPSLERDLYSNVAYSAHLGGYAYGLAVPLVMLAVRALPRDQFDLLALWSRWRRRAGFASDFPFAGPTWARPVRVEELESRPIEGLHLTPVERLREDVLDRLGENDVPEALRLHRRLLDADPRHVLPRAAQLEIANHLAEQRRHRDAADAYEAFLAAYPGAPDAPQVRLMLGLIYNRYLREYQRAAEMLRDAIDGLPAESQRLLAQRELHAAAANAAADASR